MRALDRFVLEVRRVGDFWEPGKSIQDVTGDRIVTVYRAMPAKENGVWRHRDFLTVKLSFAVRHAITSAMFNDEDFHITMKSADASKVVGAGNANEHLWMGKSIKSTLLYLITPEEEAFKVSRGKKGRAVPIERLLR